MTPKSELLDTVTRAMPYVSDGKATDKTEDREPLLEDSDSTGHLGEDKGSSKKLQEPTNPQHPLWKPRSDLRSHEGASNQNLAVYPMQTLPHLSPPVELGASPWPSRVKGHRSPSSSRTEMRSRSKKMAFSNTTQWESVARLSNIRDAIILECTRHQCRSGANSPVTRDEELRTSFEWRSSIRPNSDPDLRRMFRASNRPDLRKPQKACLEQKAKSANTTPHNESIVGSMSSVENQKLRRVKTVDFDKAISKPIQIKASSSTVGYYTGRLGKVSKRMLSCPSTAILVRRSPACPAVTRTDVHVIAIAPSSPSAAGLGSTQSREVDETDPATPTMQIVESSNGSYEIVWDDIPPEHSPRTRRRSSSASQALEAISTGSGSLERVNTKLTEWSGIWNTPSDSFKPTIVVFPDDDGRKPHFESAAVDDEDMEIFAPPNSERVSAVHSRHASRPVSARMSRAPSQDETSDTPSTQDVSLEDPVTPAEQSLVAPDPEAWSAHLVAARRKVGVPSLERKLSNIEGDLKFRNHRDSVTLAHSRLIHSSGVRPELFAHRDSVTIAKKRMHAKNHAASASGHLHERESRSEPGSLPGDGAFAIPPLPIVKAHAVDALKKGTPAPILRPSESVSHRHIRIED